MNNAEVIAFCIILLIAVSVAEIIIHEDTHVQINSYFNISSKADYWHRETVPLPNQEIGVFKEGDYLLVHSINESVFNAVHLILISLIILIGVILYKKEDKNG